MTETAVYSETFGCLLTVEERGSCRRICGAAPDPDTISREHAISHLDAARQASALEV